LSLSADQQAQILKNSQEAYQGFAIERMRTVVQEIGEETARPVLDATALGLRYAEVEAIRRQSSESLRRLNTQNLMLLTAAQRVKYDALEEAMRLLSTVEDARSVELLGSRCREIYFLFLNDGGGIGVALFRAYFGDCPDQRALEELPPV
jgi:diaminopimelate decarboxylase